MHGLAAILIGLVGFAGEGEYARSLGARALDQAALDAEGYGEKAALKREDGGLHITLGPRLKETGWKTPQQLKFGGDFTITAELIVRKLPKPAQEDGAAVGMAISFQDINQPDLTLVRLREPNNADVYRPIEKEGANNPMQMQLQMQMQMQMQMMGMGGAPPAKPPKPPRRTFPATGESVRLEFRREGNNVHYQVLDGKTGKPRYLGQAQFQQAQDVAAVKLFVTNRNGIEPVDVVLRDLTIRADRINGLGTIVRTVFDKAVYADPTAIEKGLLIVGGQPKTPPGGAPNAQPGAPASGPQPGTPAPTPPAVAAPAVAMAVAPGGGAVVIMAGPAPAVAATVVAAPPAQKPADAKPATKDGKPAEPAKPAPPPEPKARIPLDEVDSIHYERSPAMTAQFVDQPNLDFTMPGRSYKPEAAKKDVLPDNVFAPDPKDPKYLASQKAEEKKAEEKKADAKKADAKKADAKKAEEKKEEEDDVNAPPPGTTAPTKIARLNPKKNGVRDLHLTLSNLRPSPIKQVTVACQTDKGQTSWRLDTTDSEDWPIVVRRGGTESAADLFLEPPPGDCFQKDFTINVTYEDNQNANATAKAEAHTRSDLAVDTKAPAFPPLGARIHLTGDEVLAGTFEGIAKDALTITTPWKDRLTIPLTRVIGVHFAPIDRKESPESFARRLKSRGSEDLLLARTKGGEVVAIPGVVEGTEGDRMHFGYRGKGRTLPLEQVEGLVLAARTEADPTDQVQARFQLPAGVVISGRWKDMDTAVWKVDAPWGQEMKLPAAEVTEVRFRGGRMTYLSDLQPSKVEEVPYFGRKLPWRRDVNLQGEPLKMGGHAYQRGVAVHSRSVLTYDLNGRYATFEALVGFDDASKGQGRVDCRVFADEKPIYANPDLRATDEPVKLSLSLKGAEQLRLVVDYGKGQDTGDRVIWANARLYRPEPPKPKDEPRPKAESKPAPDARTKKP